VLSSDGSSAENPGVGLLCSTQTQLDRTAFTYTGITNKTFYWPTTCYHIMHPKLRVLSQNLGCGSRLELPLVLSYCPRKRFGSTSTSTMI